MSFFGDAATDQASKYDDKAGGGFKSALNEPDMTSIAAPVPTHASTGKPADSNPNALRVICDDNAGGNRNNFQPNERLSMTCSAIGGIDVTGVDWVVDDHGKTVLLVSHQGTGVSSTEEDEEGFTSKLAVSVSMMNAVSDLILQSRWAPPPPLESSWPSLASKRTKNRTGTRLS